MSNKIYVECLNCGHDISVELGEHDKQIRADERAKTLVLILDYLKYECCDDDAVGKVLDFVTQLKEHL